jgi:thioredoxin-dependent peroxiredoxin
VVFPTPPFWLTTAIVGTVAKASAMGNSRPGRGLEAAVARSIQVGDQAPDFTLPDQNGVPLALDDLKGSWVVVYFYPADDTPGCTAESCSFRDSHEDFVDAGARVIGISGQGIESHKKFAEKHQLPFTLLADDQNEVRKRYGVSKTLGVLPGRVTYVIDPDGIVRKVFSSQFRPTKHIDEALSTIRG